jgi:hypothetical protein
MIKFSSPSFKVIPFNKGINDQVSNIEMGPSELYACQNYELSDGAYSGLKSVFGYERYDGTALASTVPVVKDSDGIVTDDTARQAARDLIESVPGSSSILSVFTFNGKEYAIRYETDRHELYEATGSGWVQNSSFHALNIASSSGIIYDVKKGRFALYPSAVPNEEIVILCNSVSNPIALYVDGSSNTIAESIAGGDLPTTEYPTLSIVHSNKLLLAYPNGHLFVSGVGSPLYWSAVSDLAFEIFFGDEITNMVITPSSVIIFMEGSIKYMSSPDGIDIIVNTFSDTSGAIKGTALNFLGTVLYCSQVGIVSVETTDALGDFKAASISRNIQKFYLANKHRIIGAVSDKEKNQYVIYFNNGRGIICTFNIERKLKGATTFKYIHNPTCMYEREYFGSSDGYVFSINSAAQSFDCNTIESFAFTSFYGYGSPVLYKQFKKMTLELSASKGTLINTRPVYEYGSSSAAKASLEDIYGSTDEGVWGDSEWGSFVWSSTSQGIEYVYIRGIASNMSAQFSSSDKYHAQHTLQNITVTYNKRSLVL